MEIHILPLTEHESQVRIEADESGKTVGSAYAKVVDTTLSIDSISVPISERRKGIGTALLHSIISWGKERGAKKISGEFLPEPGSSSSSLANFYSKHGIEIDEDNRLNGNI